MSDPVLELADLESWSFSGTALAVLGHPIGHSLSPAMQNAALAVLAAADSRFSSWRYFRFDIDPADLPVALPLLHARGFLGVNLTVPHKVIAAGLVAEVDDGARPVGAVNTLVRVAAGWRGFNTDGYGLSEGMRESLGRDLAGADVLLLGAGGAARGAAVECLGRGCSSLAIANRSRPGLDALLALLGPLAGSIPLGGLLVEGGRPAAPSGGIRPGSLVINATSAGLRPDEPPPVDLAVLPRPSGVYDMVYNPPASRLLERAAALGVPCANGLSMLAHQGARSLEHWSGVPAERTVATMFAAARTAALQFAGGAATSSSQ